MALKIRVPKKEADETEKEEQDEHKPIPKVKGPIEYPKDHMPGMKVPKGGSSCSSCKYWDGDDCENKYYRKWNGGSGEIPGGNPDEYCSDWYEPK